MLRGGRILNYGVPIICLFVAVFGSVPSFARVEEMSSCLCTYRECGHCVLPYPNLEGRITSHFKTYVPEKMGENGFSTFKNILNSLRTI